MELFLDSSKLVEAERWNSVIKGATTNPTIIVKDGGCNIKEFVEFFGSRPVSLEASGDLEKSATELSALGSNVVIKITLLNSDESNNLKLISSLEKRGIKVNCTALFSVSQVLLAAEAGASYVSLFLGRIDDEGGDYMDALMSSVKYLQTGNYKSRLITGSIRTVGMVRDSILGESDICTVPPEILKKMTMHRFSLETVKMFERDALEQILE